MCGTFTCTRNSLIGLNIIYMVVAFLLIGVATYGKTSSIVTSLGVVGGIVACGVFLLFIAVLGLVGAIKHQQVFLFFYMVVLFLLFLIQFSVACACLAVNGTQRLHLAEIGWRVASNDTKHDAQEHFQCCGFDTTAFNSNDSMTDHPACPTPACCPKDTPYCCLGGTDCDLLPPCDVPCPVSQPACCPKGTPDCCVGSTACSCPSCDDLLVGAMESGLRASGGIGLFFSFTEVVGFVLALRFRRHAESDRVQVLE